MRNLNAVDATAAGTPDAAATVGGNAAGAGDAAAVVVDVACIDAAVAVVAIAADAERRSVVIEFGLDEGQLELQAAARRLFAEAGGVGLARRVMEDGPGWSPDLWRSMVGLDWAGLAIPEQYGGAGGGTVDLWAIAVESGRVVVASPLIPSSVVAATILTAAADAGHAGAAALLGDIASGAAIVAPAILEADGVWDADGIHATIDADGRVTGTKVVVPFAVQAARLIVAARDGDGITLVLVDPAAAGVAISPVENIAGLPLATVALDGAAGDVLGERGAGWAMLTPAIARGAVLRAAEISGAGESMLDLAVDYAQQRRQFGKPIGSYQAVQYLCTDVGIESHLTGLLSLRAAWLLDTGGMSGRAVAAAKLYGSRAAAHMAQQAHEVFAGLAYMMEHDLHLFTRHCKHWEFDLGSDRDHAEAMVEALEAELALD